MRAKRLECAQLAAAFGCVTPLESAGKPDALQTLRANVTRLQITESFESEYARVGMRSYCLRRKGRQLLGEKWCPG